jgi:hypothetical protein
MIDIEKLIAGVHDYLKPLVQRIKALEDRPAPKDGKDGENGKDALIDWHQIDEKVKALLAEHKAVDPSFAELYAIQEQRIKALEERSPKDGERGADGKDGAPGRDAAQIEILPCIVADKSYPRGTYAKHDGGLWRSFETTEQMRGWECIVDGLADVKIESVDREFVVSATRSSGAIEVKRVSLPVMLYQGVFKEGREYVGGDTVTWAGSLWHCDHNTADKPGELGSKGWTLAAKRGRDGKDGVNGKDFTKAVQL